VEQQPIAISELLAFTLYLGSLTFLLGAILQAFVLFISKSPFIKKVLIFVLTRGLSVITSFYILLNWDSQFDIMISFLFLPAVISEAVLNPIILIAFRIPITFNKDKKAIAN